jgi:hypothetical protein
MSGSDVNEELFAEGWATVVRYLAMLGGTLAGQVAGVVVDAAVGTRSVWIPLALSVVFEGLVGARFGGLRGGAQADARQCLGFSTRYSLALVGVSIPLLAWIAASHATAVEGGVGFSFVTPARIGVAAVAIVTATLARAGIMLALVRRAEGPTAPNRSRG